MSYIKCLLKKSNFIRNAYKWINKRFVALLVKRSPVLASKYLYKRSIGKKLNLSNPQDFNEKLQWLKLYWQNPLVTQCADKYEVRTYVEKSGCEEVLNELFGIYDNVSEIDWNLLPQKFVLKTTNGCGTNIISKDKSKLDEMESLRKLDRWLKKDYSLYAAELHYSKMKPRIICEKYLETDAGFLPNDYKIYCFNGEAKLVLVCTDRENKVKLDYFDLKWNRIDIASENYNRGDIPKKPKCFNEMLRYAEKLSKAFPFVRVDFYDYNNKPLFGEMTFTPAGCMAKYYNNIGLKMLGEWIKLPEKYIK